MELKYNLKGSERKSLVSAVSAALNQPTEYLGAPTFAYRVGGYAIDKNGTLTGPDNLDLEDALHQAGFDAADREYDEPDTYESGLSGMGALPSPEELGFETAVPAGADDETEIHNLRYFETAEGDPDEGVFAVEIPADGFRPTALDNLDKLIESKLELIKKAIGADGNLPVTRTAEGNLRFEWFPYTEDADEAEAYAAFVSKLCAAAKEKKRVTAKAREDFSNPRFSFRVWLISLGMSGSEFKTSRQILLKNLPGNSAFSSGNRPTYTVNCYTLENGNEEDPMNCESFEFHSLAKAKARANEFLEECESLHFAGCHVEDNKGKYIYEITMDGTVTEK